MISISVEQRIHETVDYEIFINVGNSDNHVNLFPVASGPIIDVLLYPADKAIRVICDDSENCIKNLVLHNKAGRLKVKIVT